MTVSGLDKQIFYDNLRYALDEETFESFADAPFDWLTECYPDILDFGGSYWHVKRVLDRLRDDYDVHNQSFIKVVLDRYEVSQHDPLLTSFYSAEEINQRNSAAVRASNLRHNIFYLAVKMPLATSFMVPDVSKGLLALQYRHTIAPFSDFTVEDYNVLTEFIRKNWGQIHPDDDPVLGMVDFPQYHYHCSPIDDAKVIA